METRRFPPPWSVEEPDPRLERQCFIVRDANGLALAYVYCEDEPGRRAAAKLLTHDQHPSNSRTVAQAAVHHSCARRLGTLKVTGITN